MNTDRVQQADLDGDGVENLVTGGLSEPATLALDLLAGKMYWTDLSDDRICRADLSGSNVEILAAGIAIPARYRASLAERSGAGREPMGFSSDGDARPNRRGD